MCIYIYIYLYTYIYIYNKYMHRAVITYIMRIMTPDLIDKRRSTRRPFTVLTRPHLQRLLCVYKGVCLAHVLNFGHSSQDGMAHVRALGGRTAEAPSPSALLWPLQPSAASPPPALGRARAAPLRCGCLATSRGRWFFTMGAK